jgi:OOP family OmpA-OmpF porin
MRSLNPTLLSTVLLAALALPAAAQAQDRAGTYDDRWYITGGAGANIQDSSRNTENAPTYTLGVGKFINPNWSVDLELNHQNPKLNPDEDLNWSQYGISLDARRHWRTPGRTWNPYALMGVGYGRSEEEYNNFPSPNSPGERSSGYPTAKLGVGVQGDYEKFSLRGELYARASFDDDSVLAPNEDVFTDGVAQFSVVVPLGARRTVAQVDPAPVIGPAPIQEEQPQYQQPEPMAVELPTVYFQFDRADLTDQGRQALGEAAATLRANPSLRAQVGGHTDSIGSQDYNQGLSERRAQVAYDYLLDQGVAHDQLEGPFGYGEDRPVAPNTNEDGSDNPEGRAMNRRTEVNPVN